VVVVAFAGSGFFGAVLVVVEVAGFFGDVVGGAGFFDTLNS
jgi:hypothetical protein